MKGQFILVTALLVSAVGIGAASATSTGGFNLSIESGSGSASCRGAFAAFGALKDDGDPGRHARHRSVANVGTRPTFDSSSRASLEAHLLDFEGDVYGRRVEFTFRHHLRAEQKFPNVDALREQIRADVALGRDRLEAP